jgi:hypothetical protein
MLKETARIALPVRVFMMKKRSRIIRRKETPMTVQLLARQVHSPDHVLVVRCERGKELGIRPEHELAAVLDEERDADRRDQERQPRGAGAPAGTPGAR